MTDFFFKTDLFAVEPGEDEETNPHRYGKQLSEWLRKKFEGLGYPVEDVIPEDWGWCVMCQRTPYSLWIACGNMVETENESAETTPQNNEMTWHCFVVAEVPFLKKIFGKVDTSEAVKKLTKELETILASEPRITLIEQP